ncbi:hypothetical protein ABZ402_46030 [Streptomyces mirabilis]|uniref:hypothetical protein n=1 Tax=Streptomyces mirabilis TaxID=68239 RepID=UPI0033F65497
MLAREYGYWVSPGNAIRSGAASAFMRERRNEIVKRRQSANEWAGWVLLAALLLFLFIGAAMGGASWGLAVALGLPALLGWLVFKTVGADTPDPVAKLVEEQPWQAWPCRVEEIDGDTSTPRKRRTLLLAPDGSVVRVFDGQMPEEVWLSMTDGVGVLWVCGDLRFSVAMAPRGGSPIWLAAPVPGPAPADSNQGPGVIEEVVRQAGQDAMRAWLNE